MKSATSSGRASRRSISERRALPPGGGGYRPWLLGLGLATWCVAVPAAPPAAHCDTPSAAAQPQQRFVAGQRHVYRLDYRSRAAYDLQALFRDQAGDGGQAQSFHVRVAGELVLTVLKTAPGKVELDFRLRNPAVTLRANGAPMGDRAERLRAHLARAAHVTSDGRGRVLTLRQQRDGDNLARNFVRTLVAITQFVTPPADHPAGSPWEAWEEDSNGRYLARYRPQAMAEDSTTITYHKSKRHYAPPAVPGNGLAVKKTIRPGGGLEARFDLAGQRLLAMRGSETQTVEVAGRDIARASNSLDLAWSRSECLQAEELLAAAAGDELGKPLPLSSDGISAAERETALQRSILGPDDLETLQARLSRPGSGEPAATGNTLYLKLKALVFLHPQVSPRLGNTLAGTGVDDPAFRLVTRALAIVGHAPAQAALVAAIDARGEDAAALSVLVPALAGVARPSAEAVARLIELAEGENADIATSAQLGLGSMARHLARHAPRRSQRIVRYLADHLAAATTAAEAQQWLAALGNAGTPQALPAIAEHARAGDAQQRAMAAWALRGIPGEAADALLLRALQGDEAENVRRAAASALAYRGMDAQGFAIQRQALLADASPAVRLASMENLWRARGDFPQVTTLVEQAAAQDPAPQVREAAAWLLASANGQGGAHEAGATAGQARGQGRPE